MEVSIIRGALRKARFSCMGTYLLFGLIGKKWMVGKMQYGLDCGLDVVDCDTGIVVRDDCSLSHSMLRVILSGEIEIDDNKIYNQSIDNGIK